MQVASLSAMHASMQVVKFFALCLASGIALTFALIHHLALRGMKAGTSPWSTRTRAAPFRRQHRPLTPIAKEANDERSRQHLRQHQIASSAPHRTP